MAAFNLYLKTINSRLAEPESLDYDFRNNLVRQALERFPELLSGGETQWLTLSEAQKVVNGVLPGRTYSKSLYSALVAEGILTEDMIRLSDGRHEEVVFISYNRFADHIIADHLLRLHLDPNDPSAAFSKNGGLAFLCDDQRYKSYGLIEALSIQIPERTGIELVRLAPGLLDHPMIGQAFLQSIVWRKLDAFYEDTFAVWDEVMQSKMIRLFDPLDTLLAVSSVPDHPFNADFLDQRLRQDSIPDRDSWWSTYLHCTWGNEGPVDRLVDWASNISGDDDVEEEVVDLAATTLAWMFTTPNRFLRDRATKALVALLTGRLESAGRLVHHFANVDDPYVTERIYAVTYGVAMRNHDVDAVTKLASIVHEHVFASGNPPPQILLRDYARGVVERAIYLGADISINLALIRPPYRSNWPEIPSENDIVSLTPNRSKGAWAEGDLEWSRNRIHNSVMDSILNDFGRYVIGSESESNWLSLRLDEDPWQSPEQRTETLLAKLDQTERAGYEEFKRAETRTLSSLPFFRRVRTDGSDNEFTLEIEDDRQKERLQESRQLLMSALTEEHRLELESIEQAKLDGSPRFDVRVIQRYVLWRVFDLGWTIDRFGEFARFYIGDHGRAANKPERMGKKYQWIAFHEILAYISDHFQYRKRYFIEEGERQYEGPWQESRRDIDPSLTLRSTPGGTSWGPHMSAWWGEELYEA